MQSACVVLYCHLWFVRLHIFPHYLMNNTVLEKRKNIEHKMCVLKSSTGFVSNISHSEKNSVICCHIYIQVCMQSVRLFFPDFNPLNAKLNPICHLLALLGAQLIFHVRRLRFNETFILPTDVRKNTQVSNFVKICPVGNRLFHADGRTDRHDEATRFSVLRTHGENGRDFS